jgi:predicted nucleic acid-binding protein
VIVVADASPLRYLILIEHADVLPTLYGQVIVPPAVLRELSSERTPATVRTWLANRPDWLRVQSARQELADLRTVLGDGEREAIALAVELAADALLMDDRDGRREAARRNCAVLGTLRVLADAAEHGLIDLRRALERLQSTNFRADNRLIREILDRAGRNRSHD